MRGQWEYAERGILDRTHLRFFTRQGIGQLFEAAGFTLERLDGINDFVDMHDGDRRLWKYYRLVGWLPNPHVRDMRYLQYSVIARANPPGSAATVRP